MLLNNPELFFVFIALVSIPAIILMIWLQKKLISPDRAAKNIKMMGLAGTARLHFMAQLKVAMEDAEARKAIIQPLLSDPQIRAMLYDAFQEEFKRRKNQR